MDEGRDLDAVALIDVASEDDLLICSSAGRLERSSGDCKSCGLPVEKPSKACMQVEQVPISSDSPEIKHNSSCKYNLRKSLAWDSAFFTSEGVLDPEELAVVNSTFKKVQIHVLPGIQEDARKSGESSTTFDSDSWAAENTEDDLFENLRASIQNFQTKCGKNPPLLHSSSTVKREKLDVTGIGHKVDSISSSASKNEQISSQAKLKPPFVPKKQGSSPRLVEKTTRSASHQRVIKAAASGSREEKPSPRPPTAAPGLHIAPSRGTSVSRSVHIKSKTEGNVGNGQPSIASKRHIAGDQCNVNHKSSPSVKSISSAKLHSTVACSSNGGSGRSGKAPLESMRKKASSTNSVQYSSKSANIYPLRASKYVSGTRNANATLKLSSSISPSSSIESFASESSSSSTSTARKPTNFNSSSPCLGVTAYNAPDDNSAAKSLKPSGLRLPSPKIGYFDAEKSLPRSANKGSQRCPQVGLIRNTSKLKNSDGPVQQENSSKGQLAASVDSSSHHLELTNHPTTGSPSLLEVKSSSSKSDNMRKSQNHSKKCPISQETSCNSKNVILKANDVSMETPGCISTLCTEEGKCQDQLQSLSKRTTITGDELTVPGEGPQEVREIAGKALGLSASMHMQDGFMGNKGHTVSNYGEKENILPSEDQMSATNHT